jgi:Fe2+ or Zn2+ uptake regulation protein
MSKLSSKKLTTSDMRRIAVEMLKETPGGMRVGEIAHRILETYPNSSKGTVWTTLSELPKKRSDVTKPSRGGAAT